MAFDLCSSFTTSLIIAVTTAPIAPAPCKSLPKRRAKISVARAQISEPIAKSKRPVIIVPFLPNLSLIIPKGV